MLGYKGDNSRFPPYLRGVVDAHTFIEHVKQPLDEEEGDGEEKHEEDEDGGGRMWGGGGRAR